MGMILELVLEPGAPDCRLSPHIDTHPLTLDSCTLLIFKCTK